MGSPVDAGIDLIIRGLMANADSIPGRFSEHRHHSIRTHEVNNGPRRLLQAKFPGTPSERNTVSRAAKQVREQGRKEMFERWRQWNQRRLDAETKGEDFDEPPPGDDIPLPQARPGAPIPDAPDLHRGID